MAIIKCKMCGGDLILTEDQSVAECEYCGSKQTVPTADNEKKLNLFASANKLRAVCEFDRAAGIYDAIRAEFPGEPEAYWGLVLCKYGIEYVDDPATGRKVPTCHRLSFDSVMDDGNLEMAMDCTDSVARKLYREEAKQLEKIRTGILEVSSNEKPYDIFICYKETDEKGERTLDSVMAQDIYSALTDKGYRVFFSRITLQSKLGEAYEPYIFAALNSAKVMLAIGTDPEYYSAVWVKNEWSRYLKICAGDKSKHLIPCYKNMDAYDLPREFRPLQGVDLGKMGAVQDILFNMEKYIPLKKQTATVIQEKVVVGNVGGSNKIASLLDRGNMALEDGDWAKADSFFEDVLNNDSKNAQAYLGKALAQERCRTMDAFVRKRKEAVENISQKTLELQPDLAHIEEVSAKYSLPGYLEEYEIRRLYDFDLRYSSEADWWENRCGEEVEYWSCHKLLSRAAKFADENILGLLLEHRGAVYDYMEERKKNAQKKEAELRTKLEADYATHMVRCDKQVEKHYSDALGCLEQDYTKWLELAETSNDPDTLAELALSFGGLRGFRDSKNLAAQCRKRATEEQTKIDAEKKQRRLLAEQKERARKKRNKAIVVGFLSAFIFTVAGTMLLTKVIIPSQTYKKAIALRDSGDYMGAVRTFREISDYKDAKERLEDFKVVYTKELYKSGKYSNDITYEYDEQGNMILKVNINQDGEENRFTYAYNEKDNLLSQVHTDPGGYRTERTYTYDENNHITSDTVIYEAGERAQTTRYRYDQSGNKVYEKDDGSTSYTLYSYDGNGNLTRMEKKSDSGSTYYTLYSYDGNGNLIHMENKSVSGSTLDYTDYTYDRKGNMLMETGEDYENTYTYDSNGNLIEKMVIRYDGWGKESYDVDWTYCYTYLYDDNGNLIREEADCRNSPHNDHRDGSRDSVTVYEDYLAFYCPKDTK